ncbi:hypothetical protein diail_7521, partial [Diaporthe ilicicola]
MRILFGVGDIVKVSREAKGLASVANVTGNALKRDRVTGCTGIINEATVFIPYTYNDTISDPKKKAWLHDRLVSCEHYRGKISHSVKKVSVKFGDNYTDATASLITSVSHFRNVEHHVPYDR